MPSNHNSHCIQSCCPLAHHGACSRDIVWQRRCVTKGVLKSTWRRLQGGWEAGTGMAHRNKHQEPRSVVSSCRVDPLLPKLWAQASTPALVHKCRIHGLTCLLIPCNHQSCPHAVWLILLCASEPLPHLLIHCLESSTLSLSGRTPVHPAEH